MASVMVKLGDDPRVIPLPAEPITVGRSSQNAIAILDSSLSRVHCEIRRVDGAILVKDLGSRNGTLVNGENVKERKLQNGDKVEVGICRIVIWIEAGQAKLEVSAGRGTAGKEGPATSRLKAESDTAERITLPQGQKLPDSVGWGKRTGGGGKAAVAGVVVGAVALLGLVAVIKKQKAGKTAVAGDPWRTFDYSSPALLSKDWRAASGTPTGLGLAGGRDGQGMEVTRTGGERGLAEAWGPSLPVEAKKAYRLTAWCRAAAGHAGLRVGWMAPGADQPFAWSGSGLSEGEGERGGTWVAPDGAAQARLECIVAGEGGRAVFDDVDFADASLPDRPPVVGRAVAAAFEAPGVFVIGTRGGAALRARVGLDGADATCAIGAKKTPGGATYSLPNPTGAPPVAVTEQRDSEGEGFVVRFTAPDAGVRLFLNTPESDVQGRTSRVTVGKAGGRVVLELRPEAEVAVRDGHVQVLFPSSEFEISFQVEAGGKGVAAGLAEAARAEQERQFGKAIQLYEEAIEKNPKGEAATAAGERVEALRAQAEEALRRARYRRADAELTGRTQGCDDAIAEYLQVEKDYDGTEYAAQSRAEREITSKMRDQLADELSDADVGKLLKMANMYLLEEKYALARAYCEAVQDRTADADMASQADSLLQRIAAKEGER